MVASVVWWNIWTCEISGDLLYYTPINGVALKPWEISFAWTGVWNEKLISKYVYKIWSANDEYIIEQTWLVLSRNLSAWSYKWNVYAEYVDWTTWWLSDTYSFNISTQSAGWWVSLRKDKCPNWDLSDSYYDWTCEKQNNQARHEKLESGRS